MPKNINKVVQATEAVEGDVATNLAFLLPHVNQVSSRPEWFAQINDWKTRFPWAYEKEGANGLIKPQTIITKLSELTDSMKDRVLITTGVGQHQMWAAQHYRWRYPRTMITSGGLGTMGYGLPASIGAKVARPDHLVIDIDGDASFSMTLTELSTAAEFNIGVKVIILNNGEQGMVTRENPSNAFLFECVLTLSLHLQNGNLSSSPTVSRIRTSATPTSSSWATQWASRRTEPSSPRNSSRN
jgi:acetolactate synthase-1/2/3 large subunit